MARRPTISRADVALLGRIAYETDVRATPRYHDGTPRCSWEQLDEIARWSWERNPTPRSAS